MLRALACLSCVACLSGAAFSQSTDSQPAFELADVHVSPPIPNPFPSMRGPFTRGGIYEVRSATMVDLVRTAYGVDADKVLGGPSWLEMDRFDVIAKSPSGARPETRKLMLQALLADRFKLVVHNDLKPLPAYALTAGKRLQLKESGGAGETGCKFTVEGLPPQGAGPVTGVPVFLESCRNITMSDFAERLRAMPMADQYLNGNPVLDKTELKGSWDFNFKYSLRGMPGAAAAEIVTINDAVEKQLGLKLDLVKIPLPVIIVDSVNRTPTANLPGVTESLPPVPTEFEVASVKPSAPDSMQRSSPFQPGGRIDLRGITLKNLITLAWTLFNDDMLVGAPKFLDTEKFDIVAKAPNTGPATGPSNGPPIDIETLRLMLRALLVERFKLAVHFEDRPLSAYTLVAVKPKLKKADPLSRTRFSEGPPADGKDPRNTNPALSRLVTCQNMTMAQFAQRLQGIAPGYIHSPVLDATGLEGAWDFTLNFSPAGMFQGGGGRGGGDAGPSSGAAAPEASLPTGGLTLLEAVEKQLGLKLQMQKRQVSVLVIDHIEQKPIDN